jgi:hypothetical protein
LVASTWACVPTGTVPRVTTTQEGPPDPVRVVVRLGDAKHHDPPVEVTIVGPGFSTTISIAKRKRAVTLPGPGHYSFHIGGSDVTGPTSGCGWEGDAHEEDIAEPTVVRLDVVGWCA